MIRRVILKVGTGMLVALVGLLGFSLAGNPVQITYGAQKSIKHNTLGFPATNINTAGVQTMLDPQTPTPTPTPDAYESVRADSNPADQSPSIKFGQISVDQGLSSNSVLSMMQDSLGFIWFGTSHGLDRFDGYNFNTYLSDPKDPYSLSHNIVYSLYEDHLGIIWVGTYGGGLNRFDRDQERFTRYQHDPGDPRSISNNIIFTIFEDRTGNLWFGTVGGGLERFDRETGGFIHYAPDTQDPYSQPGKHVYAITEDRSGALWVGTDNGLAYYDRQTGRFNRYQHDPSNPNSISSEAPRMMTRCTNSFSTVPCTEL